MSCDTSTTEGPRILELLALNYDQLPEQAIAKSVNGRFYAQYAMPTSKYSHGVLGDQIEAEKLVVVRDSTFYELVLAENFVFEDIRPRLYDVDGDGDMEIITIRTDLTNGAGIAIYKIQDGEIREYSSIREIGKSNRWLNIVAIDDLDNDGIVEIVWIETPHIGGVLKIARISNGVLDVISEEAGYSNHGLGDRNLCLSVLTDQMTSKVFYVPIQNRLKIVGFEFKDDELMKVEEINLEVDFSESLLSQHDFNNIVADPVNCINLN
jgi:hypothetical protein